jgi:hypothetical protein
VSDGGAPAGVVEFIANMGFAGVACVAGVLFEPVPPKRELPVVALPPPKGPPSLLAGAGVDVLLSCDPNSPPEGKAPVVVGVVLAVAVFGVEDELPNRLPPVVVVVVVVAGLLPNRLVLEGVCDEAPKKPPPAPPPSVGVVELGVPPLVAPNNDFCSPGFAPAFPNTPALEAPEEAVVVLLPPPPRLPNEIVGVLLPKIPPDEVVGVVEEPNSPPLAGALEVAALLFD